MRSLLPLVAGLTMSCRGGTRPADKYDEIIRRRPINSSTVEYQLNPASYSSLTIRLDHDERIRLDYVARAYLEQQPTQRTLLFLQDQVFYCVSPYEPGPNANGVCIGSPMASFERSAFTSAERRTAIRKRSERAIAGLPTSCFEMATPWDRDIAFTECYSDNGALLYADGQSAADLVSALDFDIRSAELHSTPAGTTTSGTLEALSVQESVDDSAFTPPFPVIDAATP